MTLNGYSLKTITLKRMSDVVSDILIRLFTSLYIFTFSKFWMVFFMAQHSLEQS